EVGDGADVLSGRGAPLESEYPYSDDSSTFKKTPPAKLDASAAKHKIVNPMKVRANIDHIKAALKAGFPVVFGFEVYSSFESSTVARTGVVPMPKRGEQLLGGHCTYFIGYTDSDGNAHFNKTSHAVRFHVSRLFGSLTHHLRRLTGFTALAVTPPANCLISANSWGTGWGDGGYFYLPFAFVTKYAADFYIFGDVTKG
ncbi:MAG TPA: C1 family peptidase, partial [Chroococcales cyanobacterium]